MSRARHLTSVTELVDEAAETGAPFDLQDNRPRITFEFDGGDYKTHIVFANQIEIGRLHETGAGKFRIPNTTETRETRDAAVEYLLEQYISRVANMPRVCVTRNIPLLFHQAATEIEKIVGRALDFGVLDRGEFHHLLFNLQMMCANAKPDALSYFVERLTPLLALSAEGVRSPQEIELMLADKGELELSLGGEKRG